jgi:hypothetical protein
MARLNHVDEIVTVALPAKKIVSPNRPEIA